MPERFQAAHILLRLNCECERAEQLKIAEEVLAKLQAGQDFAELAKTYSQDGSAADGGDLGRWVRRDELVEPFANALAELQAGAVSGIVETQFGLHIIKLLGREPARQQSLDEVSEIIEEGLRRTYLRDRIADRAQGYMPGPTAVFNQSALERFLTPRN